jgi:uncharacterized protein YjbI with pentapeptide repeats
MGFVRAGPPLLSLLGLSIFLLSFCAAADESSGDRDAKPDSLVNAQIQNQRAQARYYSRLSDKRGFWKNLREFGWPVGALSLGVAAITAVVLGQRSYLRSRSDSEFHETIKRFGQQDSAALRLTAATALAQIGVHSNRFYESAFDQLSLEFLSEPREHVREAIQFAIGRLVKRNPGKSLQKLDALNRVLRVSLAEALHALFFAAGGDPLESVPEDGWACAEKLTEFDRTSLQGLIRGLSKDQNGQDRPDSSRRMIRAAGGEARQAVEKILADRAAMLRLNIRLIGESLDYLAAQTPRSSGAGFPDFTSSVRSFSSTFLAYGEFRNLESSQICRAVLRKAKMAAANLGHTRLLGVDLSGADLSYADLSFVECKDTQLTGANLSHANLRGARIQNTDIAGADLTGAVFRNTQIAPAAFQGTQWWKADFGRQRELLKAVYASLKQELPDMEHLYVRGDIHRSVLDFIGKITEERY